MDIAAFDAWRAAYDTLSYADQQAFYDRLEADHPVQAGYNANAFARFLEYAGGQDRYSVLEMGGWKGELAQLMLDRFPRIVVWCNLEICRAAVEKSVLHSGRYATWTPSDHPWRVKLPATRVVVASHFIEHIRAAEMGELFDRLPAAVRYVGLQAPLPERGPVDWTGYHGSHILEIGWHGVGELLKARRFRPVGWLFDVTGIGEFRAYER